MLIDEPLSEQIIGAAIEVHRWIGRRLESAYQQCLAREFELRGLAFERELKLPIEYKGITLDVGYRMDFVVGQKIVVEVKAVEKILPVHECSSSPTSS